MSTSDPLWLIDARRIAETILWPGAQQADRADSLPIRNIGVLADSGLLGINIPVGFGGKGGGLPEIAQLFEVLGSGCGVTLFVALQHMLACSHVSGSTNRDLRAAWLPSMATGQTFATVAFSQLRRPGPPMLRCIRSKEGYVFEGTAPWSTGWGLASQIVLGGTLDDGALLFALVPADARGLTASRPMELCAMNASMTVTLTCANVEVGPERFIKTISREQLTRSDQRGMYLVASLSHGVTQGSLRHLRKLAVDRPSTALNDVIIGIESRLDQIKRDTAQWVDRSDDSRYAQEAVRIRASAITLSVQAAHAAVIASAGSANALDHPAQRLFREAMLYSLTAQTRDLQTAMLEGFVFDRSF